MNNAMTTTTLALEELRLACEQLSAAAAAGAPADLKLVEFFKGLMPKVSQYFNAVKDLAGFTKQPGLTSDQAKFIKRLDLHNYNELREFKAFRPAGLEGTYLQYAKALEDAVDHILMFQPKVLSPYLVFLAQLTSSRQAALSTEDHDRFNAQLRKNREAVQKEVSKLFVASVEHTEGKLGRLIERNADWHELFRNMASLTSKINGMKLSEIQNQVKQAEDYLEIIYQAAQSGRLESATPEVMQGLADGAYQVASELEFLSVTYYNVKIFTQAIDDTVNALTKALS